MSSVYVIYRVKVDNFDVDGLFLAPTRSRATTLIKQAVKDFIINEEGIKKSNTAFELLEREDNDITKLKENGLFIKYANDKNVIEIYSKEIVNKKVDGWVWSTQEEVNTKLLYKYGFTLIIQSENSRIDIPKCTLYDGESTISSSNTVKSLMCYGKEKDHGQHTAVINELKNVLNKRRENIKEDIGYDIVNKVEENLNNKFKM